MTNKKNKCESRYKGGKLVLRCAQDDNSWVVNFWCRTLKKCQRLQLGNFEAFAAAHIAAGYEIVAPHHVGLCFGESGPVALVGIARQLGALTPDYPVDLVFAGLAAVRANQRVCLLLIG